MSSCAPIYQNLQQPVYSHPSYVFALTKSIRTLKPLQSKVDNVRLSGANGSAVYNADLIPCSEDGQPVDGLNVIADGDKEDIKYEGNDELYLQSQKPFQIRITVSRAREGLAAKKYYESLFAKGREGNAVGDDDEKLKELRDNVEAARLDNGGSGGEDNRGALGYYVEMMLLEPYVDESDVAIPPPLALDKSAPNSRSSGTSEITHIANEERKSVFDQDIFSSPQFNSRGPWEDVNIKAFEHIGLDVRKALVRVEFPVFPEGCKDKTFREVYQLNARVSSLFLCVIRFLAYAARLFFFLIALSWIEMFFLVNLFSESSS